MPLIRYWDLDDIPLDDIPMETMVTFPSEAVATVDFIINNLSVEDLQVVTRDIISSSITAISSSDLSHLTNSLQMAFSHAELSTILHSVIQASLGYSVPDTEARRIDTYLAPREQALRTIAEFERVKGQLVSQYAGRYVAFSQG
jgi:hypothetical protein